jgi:5-methylcytosine-specific restriction endonuclease McrA
MHSTSPRTFRYLEVLEHGQLHPTFKRTPTWSGAPSAPVDLHWAMVFGSDDEPVMLPSSTPLEAWYWRVIRCPYCDGQHWHRGFDALAPESVIGDRSNDPRQFLGGRQAHCRRNDDLWWAWPEYRLVPIAWRADRRGEALAEQADLDRTFPLVDDGTEIIPAHGGAPVRVFRVDRGLIHVKEITPVKRPRSRTEPAPGTARSPISREIRSAVWSKSDGLCWYCGCDLDPFLTFQVDHLHPVSRGGGNDLHNLVPACRSCNSAKHARTIDEFRSARGGGRFWFEIAMTEEATR